MCKSDKPVSTSVVFGELFVEFVSNRLMHYGFVGHLLQVDWFIMLFTS